MRATPDTEPAAGVARGRVPLLIAHRGYPRRYPENSVVGIRAALACGAAAVECDVQLSADHRPVVVHDADLGRTAGVAGDVRDMTAAALAAIEVNETARLGPRFQGTRIPRLHEIVGIARGHPEAIFFLDVKRASLRRFGVDVVLNAILAEIDAADPSWVVVSFDRHVAETARARGVTRTGWVLDDWNDMPEGASRALVPDYLFCAARTVPSGASLPAGHWKWAIYDINDPAEAVDFAERGADFVETDAIGEMLASPLLKPQPPAPRP
jgi:glycerophosphoryl diester phosphodiesterase